jgi:polysaccharide export outer membrane protein
MNLTRMKIKSSLFFISIFAIILISSCVPQKKILYLQDLSEEDTAMNMTHQLKADYKVQPGDNLYINIFSLEEKAMSYFNREAQMRTNYYNPIGVYLNSYSVNDSGYIDFPLAGEIYVKDHTVQQIKLELQKIIDEYLKETTVVVKLVNFTFSMLGEFRKPGQYYVYQDYINIFEAISMAGDLTDFAKRSEVAIVRQTESGSVIRRLNLNDKRIIESEFYLLKPNDIIYAPPLKGKQFSFANFPYALVLTSITTVLVIVAFFQR